MNYPEYIEVKGKEYKINTDFRVALKCNEIAEDNNINDVERALAIIYLLFGEEALNDIENLSELLRLAEDFLSCKKPLERASGKPDMDFIEDMDYIEASFMSDYGINLAETKMHWWKFFKLINGLSDSELGNCCVLNRVRNLRTFDVSKIKDKKERDKIIEAQKKVELKRNKKENHITDKQEKSMEEFNKKFRI